MNAKNYLNMQYKNLKNVQMTQSQDAENAKNLVMKKKNSNKWQNL